MLFTFFMTSFSIFFFFFDNVIENKSLSAKKQKKAGRKLLDYGGFLSEGESKMSIGLFVIKV